ncbi:hypothetical protein T484DRAFT_1851876 [Baffinella frigidus]|nr:hypothetical protein T484DRAFT_1851876 [Cryptophyta sp. CCMP2293]
MNRDSSPEIGPLVTTVRESSFALALTSMSPEGRQAILDIHQAVPHLATLLDSPDIYSAAVPHLATLLDSPDIYSRRHGATALGNLAMDTSGRRTILEARNPSNTFSVEKKFTFSVVEKFVELLGSSDLDCCRSASLALGNLVIEDEARLRFLSCASSVKSLADQDEARLRFLGCTSSVKSLADQVASPNLTAVSYPCPEP